MHARATIIISPGYRLTFSSHGMIQKTPWPDLVRWRLIPKLAWGRLRELYGAGRTVRYPSIGAQRVESLRNTNCNINTV
jgi:hypothetical protein